MIWVTEGLQNILVSALKIKIVLVWDCPQYLKLFSPTWFPDVTIFPGWHYWGICVPTLPLTMGPVPPFAAKIHKQNPNIHSLPLALQIYGCYLISSFLFPSANLQAFHGHRKSCCSEGNRKPAGWLGLPLCLAPNDAIPMLSFHSWPHGNLFGGNFLPGLEKNKAHILSIPEQKLLCMWLYRVRGRAKT